MGLIGEFVLEWYTRQMGTQNEPYFPNNATQALYSKPSGLGPKYAHIFT